MFIFSAIGVFLGVLGVINITVTLIKLDTSDQEYLENMNQNLISYLERVWGVKKVGFTGFKSKVYGDDLVKYKMYSHWEIDFEDQSSEESLLDFENRVIQHRKLVEINLKNFEVKYNLKDQVSMELKYKGKSF